MRRQGLYDTNGARGYTNPSLEIRKKRKAYHLMLRKPESALLRGLSASVSRSREIVLKGEMTRAGFTFLAVRHTPYYDHRRGTHIGYIAPGTRFRGRVRHGCWVQVERDLAWVPEATLKRLRPTQTWHRFCCSLRAPSDGDITAASAHHNSSTCLVRIPRRKPARAPWRSGSLAKKAPRSVCPTAEYTGDCGLSVRSLSCKNVSACNGNGRRKGGAKEQRFPSPDAGSRQHEPAKNTSGSPTSRPPVKNLHELESADLPCSELAAPAHLMHQCSLKERTCSSTAAGNLQHEHAMTNEGSQTTRPPVKNVRDGESEDLCRPELASSTPLLRQCSLNGANVQVPPESCQKWHATRSGGFARGSAPKKRRRTQ
mmetsp:Transcript_13642/g.26614  ORF Transcript_13642/g.26614 Transcript_13642/m.26614 type:complete len:370 (+) Transcript_13642:123-1232(+)